ncbi:MAG: helix-turn-helix domain-containing protein [Ktedonobacteraceae bacterium]|nr:helix-turn-helix domain-containing protein [Ktedonobacteraceae bacterium]
MRKQKTLQNTMTNEPLEPLLTISQVVQILQVSRPTFYTLVGKGLPTMKLGKAVRVSPGSLKRWLAQREEIA